MWVVAYTGTFKLYSNEPWLGCLPQGGTCSFWTFDMVRCSCRMGWNGYAIVTCQQTIICIHNLTIMYIYTYCITLFSHFLFDRTFALVFVVHLGASMVQGATARSHGWSQRDPDPICNLGAFASFFVLNNSNAIQICWLNIAICIPFRSKNLWKSHDVLVSLGCVKTQWGLIIQWESHDRIGGWENVAGG